jgi:hypothetical protein
MKSDKTSTPPSGPSPSPDDRAARNLDAEQQRKLDADAQRKQLGRDDGTAVQMKTADGGSAKTPDGSPKPPDGQSDPNFKPAAEAGASRLPFNPDSPDPGSAPMQPNTRERDRAAASRLDHPGAPGSTAPRPGTPGDTSGRPKTPDEVGRQNLDDRERALLKMLVLGQSHPNAIAVMSGGTPQDVGKQIRSLIAEGLVEEIPGGGYRASSRGAYLAGQVPEDAALKANRADQRKAQQAARSEPANRGPAPSPSSGPSSPPSPGPGTSPSPRR